MPVTDGAIKIAGWIDEFCHFAMPFAEVRVFPVKKGGDNADDEHASCDGKQTEETFFPERPVFDSGDNE